MGYQDVIAQWLQRRSGLFAIFHLEVRFIRSINQAFGIATGDALIAGVEQHLRAWCGDEGLVTHPWSNEFAVIHAVDSPMGAITEANRLMDSLNEAGMMADLVAVEFESLHRYAMGVVVLRGADALEAGLCAAAAACADAKQRGASEIVFHAPDALRDGGVQDNLRNLRALQRCMQERSLVIHAQPIVDLQARDYPMVKAETLVRLAPRDGFAAAPYHLLETARAMHVMPDVDLYVVRTALEQMELYPRIIDALESVSINLSAQTLMDAPAMRELHQLLVRAEVGADKIAFEITETDAVTHLTETRDRLKRLRNLGCRFVLDDFGVGYCSFGYLSQLAVDEIKIDGLFVREIDSRPENEHIIRAIHSVATALGKRTTIEYIEAAGMAERLRDIGIHYGQGWRFHPAMPLQDLDALLLKRAN